MVWPLSAKAAVAAVDYGGEGAPPRRGGCMTARVALPHTRHSESSGNSVAVGVVNM